MENKEENIKLGTGVVETLNSEDAKELGMETISDEDLDKVSNIIESELSDDEKTLRRIQAGDIPEELKDESDTVPLQGVLNPETGEFTVTQKTDDEIEAGWEELQKELEDVKPIELTVDNIKPILEKGIYKDTDNLSTEDVQTIFDLIKKREDGKKIKYGELPKEVQSNIMKTIMDLGQERNAPYLSNNELKNQMATMFIDTVAESAIQKEMKSAFKDLNSIVNNTTRLELGKAVNKSRGTQYTIMTEKLPEVAKKIKEEDPEKAKEILQVSEAYKESYSLQDLYNSYAKGKPKIKAIQIDKFKRHCDDFDRLYTGTNWKVQKIGTLVPIMQRNFPDVSEKVIKAFVVLFINYTTMKRLNPKTSLHDHTFIYYTIYNISTLDLYRGREDLSEEESKFYNGLIINIRRLLELIEDRI